jgi:teichuronic acid biosynthesis glycosyltransferase TuaG
LKKNGDVLCATARELMTLDGTLTGRVIPVKERITYKDLLRQNWINNSSVLARKDVLLEFPMEADDVHEDYLLWLRVLGKYQTASAVNEPLLKYRVSSVGKSGSKLQSAVMTYKTYKKAGMGNAQAAKCFICYAISGFKKYYT